MLVGKPLILKPMQKVLELKNNQEELLVVVDENDNILDYLPRKDVHKKKLLHRTISVVILNSKEEVVLQKRSMNADTYPGMLGNAVGGHVTKGKDYAETAKKEALEELSLKVPLVFIKKTIVEDKIHRTMTAIYKIMSDGPFKKNSDEIDDIIAMPVDELEKPSSNLYPVTKFILREIGII